MPSSVSYGLITVQSPYDPSSPTGANQWAFFLASGSVTRSQYEDNTYITDDGGPLPSPTGFDLSNASSSVTLLLQDSSFRVGSGSLCLANPSGGGGNLAVFDFNGAEVYVYAAPAGWLASAAAWDGQYLYWVESSTTVTGGNSFNSRVRKSDAMFASVITLATYTLSFGTIGTVVRPISPRLTATRLFFTLQWDSRYSDISFEISSLNFTVHSPFPTPDRSFQQVDAIGYVRSDGSSIYAARGTYNSSTFPLTQMIWIQQDDPTFSPLPIWPDDIANPAWGNGAVIRFGNLGFIDGVFQEQLTTGEVIRGSQVGETEPSPLTSFTPGNHPTLMTAPTIFAYAHPFPTPYHIAPIRLSIAETSTLTVSTPSSGNLYAFIDDGAGNFYGCLYSGSNFASIRNMFVEPSGFMGGNLNLCTCINHDSAGKVSDGSLIYFSSTGNFVWDVDANVSHPIVSGSLTTAPITAPLYLNGYVYWWESVIPVSGPVTASTINHDLWQARADGSSASLLSTFTVGFPSSYVEAVDQNLFITGVGGYLGDGLHITWGNGVGSPQRVIPGSVVITAGAVTGTDNGVGVITGTGISTGTINYTTGACTVTFSTAPAVGVVVQGICEVDWTAGDTWTVGAGYGGALSAGGFATVSAAVINQTTSAFLPQNTVIGTSKICLITLPISGSPGSDSASALPVADTTDGVGWGSYPGVPSDGGSIVAANSALSTLFQRLDSGGSAANYVALWPYTGTWVIGSSNASSSVNLQTASIYDGSGAFISNLVGGSFGGSPTTAYAINPVPSGPLAGFGPTVIFLKG